MFYYSMFLLLMYMIFVFISYLQEAAEKPKGIVFTNPLEDEDIPVKDDQTAPGDCFNFPY